MAKKTFDTMAQDFQSEMNRAIYSLTMSRTDDEVVDARKACVKIISKYSRDLQQFIQNITLQAITDHAKMQKLLQDRFNLDPEKADLTFCINRNTIRWTIRLNNGVIFDFMSKKEDGVDLDKFGDFCMMMLS